MIWANFRVRITSHSSDYGVSNEQLSSKSYNYILKFNSSKNKPSCSLKV